MDTASPARVRIPGGDELARIWNGYARKVYGSYSPLNAALAAAVAGDGRLLEAVRALPSHARDPNMLLAAIQYLVLAGADGPLPDIYRQPAGRAFPPPEKLAALMRDFWSRHRQDLETLLAERRVQTNETGRGPALALGLIEAARHLGRADAPLDVIDAGASAGLNLLLDRYRLDYGEGRVLGDAGSPVRITCRLTPSGAAVPEHLPPLGRRLGIDHDPVDLNDEDRVRWVLACIWPGTSRQARARSAIALARTRPPEVRAADMVSALPSALAELGPGPAAVVTSWSYSYLDPDGRAGFEAALSARGRQEPVAWICLDTAGVSPLFATEAPPPEGMDIPSLLGVAVFAAGSPVARTVAHVHSHGSWVHLIG